MGEVDCRVSLVSGMFVLMVVPMREDRDIL